MNNYACLVFYVKTMCAMTYPGLPGKAVGKKAMKLFYFYCYNQKTTE